MYACPSPTLIFICPLLQTLSFYDFFTIEIIQIGTYKGKTITIVTPHLHSQPYDDIGGLCLFEEFRSELETYNGLCECYSTAKQVYQMVTWNIC